MASFEPINHFDPNEPPPRPLTPPVRRGFLMVLALLTLAAVLVYGIPYVAERSGYAWEAGRSRAASDALRKLEKDDIVGRSSILFRLAITKVAPAVVNIRTLRTPNRGDNGAEGVGPPAGPLGSNLVEIGSGSGVVIDTERGLVVTNNHVVKDGEVWIVRLSRGSDYPAKLVGTDPKTDLAVLQVKGTLDVAAEWGDSDHVDVGDWVLAIGSPFMLDQTVTAGIISATRRNNLPLPMGDVQQYQDFIQTDAAVNPGNSGGPLIDLNGRIVGINTAIFSAGGGNNGIGLAISASMARRVVDDLVQHGRVMRGYLGVEYTAAANARLGARPAGGVNVARVEPDGPADRAGIRGGDRIVRIGDKPIEGPADLRNLVANLRPGQNVPVELVRDGKAESLTVTIAEWPVLAGYGVQLRDAPPEVARRFPDNPPRAVVIRDVAPMSEATRAGLLPNLRVLRVGGQPVNSVAEVDAVLAALDTSKGIPLTVQILDGRTADIRLGGPAPSPDR